MPKIILASTSKYRKNLLSRLGFEFETADPALDESPFKAMDYTPLELSQVLAKEKALSVAKKNPDSIIIGSDQVCAIENTIFSKPVTVQKAQETLRELSRKTHYLYTSVCLYSLDKTTVFTNTTKLKMYDLSNNQIDKYIQIDQPLDCAGSYKLESYGIQLFESIETSDFTAIEGLPLIELNKFLKELICK